MARHCWHDAGIVLDSYPLIYTKYCCYCDERISSQIKYSDRQHGQYFNSFKVQTYFEYVVVWPKDNGKCSGR